MVWAAIKTEYITTDTSYRKLAEKYGVSYVQIGNMGRKENWVEQRQQYLDKTLTKSLKKTSDTQASRAAKLQDVTGKLLDAVEKRLQRISEGTAKAQEYRQLASAIKDIRDIQMVKSDLDVEEQKARIRNLQRQAEGESRDTTVVVQFEEDISKWSK